MADMPKETKKARKSRTTSSISQGEGSRKASDQSQAEVIASILSKRQTREDQRQGKLQARSKRPNIGKESNTESVKTTHLSSDMPKGRVSRRVNQSRTVQESSKFVRKNLNQGRYRRQNSTSKSSADKVARLLRSHGQSKVSKSEPKQVDPDRPPRKRQRKHTKGNAHNSAHEDNFCSNMAKIKRRVKYLLTRVNLEQNYIEAYSAEGWKGQSREKIRPERELEKAKAQILQFQLGIRDAIRQLDSLGLMEGCVYRSDGRIHHRDIFCSKCNIQESGENKDIILCDGFCDRAFHQMCLVPPLETDDIPPENEGWLCPICECKMECLEVVNAYLGTSYSMDDHWQNIFAEAAAFASGDRKLDIQDELLPSEDSEDDDYNPDGANYGRDKDSNESHGSGSEAASDESGGGEDSDSDSNSNDEEYSKCSLLEELAGIMESGYNEANGLNMKNHEEECALIDEDGVVVSEKRQRKEVDYKKLHDEMFGKSSMLEEASEDEEWGPNKRMRKARNPGQSSYNEFKRKQIVQAESNGHDIKPGRVCLPPDIVEKLREAFKENSLPSRACKEGLSKQLGLSFRKVHVWFRNVRAVALRKGLVEASRARRRSLSKPIGTKEEEIKKCDAEAKAKEQWWLATMDMLNEATLKIEKLKVLLQDTTRSDNCGALMYVAVAELKERTSASASNL